MTKTIETKWQYIARRCKDEGFHESAEIAAEIDNIIYILRYSAVTDDWVASYPHMMDEMSIDDIAHRCDWCTPCMTESGGHLPTTKTCDGCLFNKNEGADLFDNFVDVLEEEENVIE